MKKKLGLKFDSTFTVQNLMMIMMPTILIVDDQMMMANFLAYYFRKNFRIVCKSDGIQAMTWLDKGNVPCIILADIDISKHNSFEFLKTLKSAEVFSSIPVILLSEKERSEDKLAGVKLGADDCLTKPFNPEELRWKMERIILSDAG